MNIHNITLNTALNLDVQIGAGQYMRRRRYEDYVEWGVKDEEDMWIMLLNSGRGWCPNGSRRRHVRGQGSADRHSLPWTSGGVSDDEQHLRLPWKGILEVLLGALGTGYLGVAWWGVPSSTCVLPVWMKMSTLTLKKIEAEILEAYPYTHMQGSSHMQVRELHIDAVLMTPPCN